MVLPTLNRISKSHVWLCSAW